MDGHKKELLGGAAGAVVGTIAGGPVGGMVGAAIGAAAGALIEDKKVIPALAPAVSYTGPTPDDIRNLIADTMSTPAPSDSGGGGSAPSYTPGPPANVPAPMAPTVSSVIATPSVISSTTPSGTTVTDPNSGTVSTVKTPDAKAEPTKVLTFKLPTAPKAPAVAGGAAATAAASTKVAPSISSTKPAPSPTVRRMVPHGEFGCEAYKTYVKRIKQGTANANMGWEFGKIELPFNTTIVTENDAYSYLDSTNSQIMSVDNDIRMASLPDDFINSWEFFKADWSKFYAQGKEESHHLDAATWMDKTDPYVAKTIQFQTQMKKLGQAKNVPGVVTDADSTFDVQGNPITGMGTATKIAIGAGIGVGGILLLKVLT